MPTGTGKKVVIGSVVTVEIHLLRKEMHAYSGGYTSIETWVKYENSNDSSGKFEYTITENPSKPFEVHPLSFIGRALIGLSEGGEVEVNVGGLGKNDIRIGMISGNHQKLKVVSIE